MKIARRPWWLAGGLLVLGLSRADPLLAQGPASPSPGSVEDQRAWLLRQVRTGEATGRLALAEDALGRLRLLVPDDPETLSALVEIELAGQKYEQAESNLKRLRAVAPGTPALAEAERLWRYWRGDRRAELEQARLYAAGGRDEEALAIYRKLFDDNPPGLQLGMEYWRLRGGQPDGLGLATQRLQALDRRYPGNSVVLQVLAQFLFKLDRDNEALAALARMGANPESSGLAAQAEWHYLQRQPATEQNVRRLTSFIGRYPGTYLATDAVKLRAQQSRRVSDPAWRAGLQGQHLLDVGRNAEAEAAFRQALSRYPDEPGLVGGLGLALMRQGKRDQALGYFRKALAGNPDNAGKWRALFRSTQYWDWMEQAGRALDEAQIERAAQLYAQAHAQQPREINAILGLASVALARGDDDAAEQQLLLARKLAPQDQEVLRRLVQLYGRTDPDKMQRLLAALPASQRSLYAQDLQRIHLQQLRDRRERAIAASDPASAIVLGRELGKALPGDPWLAFSQANLLRDLGEDSEADAVVEDMVGHAGTDPQARYAQALYLSSADQPQAALDALAAVPRRDWDDGMQALAARIRRQRLMRQVWDLHGQGREAEAITLLHQLPGPDSDLIEAEWASQRDDHATALQLYGQVLAQRPDDAEAQLGQVLSWIATGERQRAAEVMRDHAPEPAADDVPAQQRLAEAWLGLGEDGRALEVMRQLIAQQDKPAPQLLRDTARLLRSRDRQQALDLYALAMRDAGLLDPTQAVPRDDRALTRASRSDETDDWLRASLRSDVREFYQQQDPTLTLMQQHDSRSDGSAGISRLGRDTRIAHFAAPVAGGLGWARLEQARLDAGRFALGQDGRYTTDFGSCDLRVTLADGSARQVAGCTGSVHQRVVSGVGWAAGWSTPDGDFQWDIGHTPSGYAVGNWLGGVGTSGKWGVLGWSTTLSRRPLSNSLLSQAGAVDPRTGIRWGGVTANGVTFGLGYDQGGRNGIWSSWGWHRLLGHNVVDNDRIRVMGGWYHKLIMHPDLRLDIGLSAMYWRYRYDLGGYSLGQGGYYSPQRYNSVGLPVDFAWRNENWSVRLQGSISLSRASTDSISRFPDKALAAKILASVAGDYAGASFDQDALYTRGGSSSGHGYRLQAAVERRLGDHLVVGLAATAQRSQDYSPNTVQLYLRYSFRQWQGDLPLPVEPLTPYGEYR